MMVAEAAETCRWFIIYVKAYFTGVHLLVHYISVNMSWVHALDILNCLRVVPFAICFSLTELHAHLLQTQASCNCEAAPSIEGSLVRLVLLACILIFITAKKNSNESRIPQPDLYCSLYPVDIFAGWGVLDKIKKFEFGKPTKLFGRSRWPRGSAAASLLGWRVRIPSGAWMSVSCECCVLSGRGLCVGLITRPEESYRVRCVWVWSWSLDNEEAMAHQGLLCHGDKRACRSRWTCRLRRGSAAA